MGRAYRRNYKDLVGKPLVLASEILETSDSVGPAVSPVSPMPSLFTGEDTFFPTKPMRLSSLKLETDIPLSAGVIMVTVFIDGSAVVSVPILPSSPLPVYSFDVKNGLDITVDEGAEVIVAVEVTTAIAFGTAVKATLSYDLMEYKV